MASMETGLLPQSPRRVRQTVMVCKSLDPDENFHQEKSYLASQKQ